LRTLYVVVFITHARRELVHLNITASPTAAGIWQQVIEATPWGRKPRYFLRDRDAADGGAFVQRAGRLGIQTLLSPVQAPRAHAVAERVIRTLRNECLDHLIIVNEQHLRAMLAAFVEYYNTERPLCWLLTRSLWRCIAKTRIVSRQRTSRQQDVAGHIGRYSLRATRRLAADGGEDGRWIGERDLQWRTSFGASNKSGGLVPSRSSTASPSGRDRPRAD
jgi:hypothetical protein